MEGTWCDVDFVRRVTGVDITDDQLFQAQNVLEMMTNCTTAASADLYVSDRRKLGLALAYQAAWQSQQLDYHNRLDMTRLEQDAVRVTFQTENLPLILAPLCRQALMRLSWTRSRSVRTNDPVPWLRRNASTRRPPGIWLNEGEDADDDWSPLPGQD